MRRVILLICTLVMTGTAAARDSVEWVTEHFEPYYIANGTLAGKGIADRINHALMKELPDYDHRIAYRPILRITAGLKAGDQAVVTSYLKNPADQEFAQYSITSLVVPPLELTLRHSEWMSKWGGAEKISIKALLSRGMTIGIAQRRYYGDDLMPILNAELKAKQSRVHSTYASHYRSLADMVARKRIDATIGYAAELKFYDMTSETREPLVSVPIVENPHILYAYVVMPKGDYGDKLKVAVDAALRRIRTTDAYQDIMFEWFGRSPAFVAAVKERFRSND